MQLHQRLNHSTNIIDLLEPSTDHVARGRTLRRLLKLAARSPRRETARGALFWPGMRAGGWEDASFAVIGAAGLAAIVLALRVVL